jgi:HSP20 family protein
MTFTRWQKPNFWSYSPLRRAVSLRQELDTLFNQAFLDVQDASCNSSSCGSQESWLPAIDLYEGKDSLVAKVELPGLKKEDIDVSLENGILAVSGERKQDKEVVARFHRTVNLPLKVDADKVTASYTDGVLTVTLAKSEEVKPKNIPVNVI